MDAGAYCRAVESYLCGKNDGHLIRIVGPAFELVCAWADAGVPLSVVRRGIDQRYSRYHAKGSRRRYPLRIEFCETDVSTLFDDWKRAVHVSSAGTAEVGASSETPAPGASPTGRGTRRRRRSLAAHLDYLATVLAGWTSPAADASPVLDQAISRARSVVDTARPGAAALRGAPRQTLVERLAALEHTLTEAAREDTDAATAARLRTEAAGSLAPFRERMRPDAFAAAVDTATDRLLADHWRLPRVTYD